MGNSKKTFVLWGGRLDEKPDDEAFAFQSSIKIDKRFVLEDIEGSRAHCRMLGRQGIIEADAAAKLDGELAEIAREIEDGALEVDESFEDVHSFIEALLTERLGDAGRMLHSGRSRNDQTAVDLRLYLKKAVHLIKDELKSAISTLLDIAEKHTETLMSEYTHLQRAQCGTLAHYLCAYACALKRDLERFSDAAKRFNECPLGACALAGSTLNLDRESVARELGFERPTLNSIDSISDRDFALELASCAAIAQVHLSRFCEDIVIWASEEFKFVDLDERWSTGSSIMPQKKNPDFAELVRGKAGRTAGNLITLLTVLKGLPYTYGKDLQEDKEALFDSLDTVLLSLRVFRGMLSGARWNIARLAASCTGGFLEATDAAEYLVLKGLPFRKAHEVSAALVKRAISEGKSSLSGFNIAVFKEASPLFERDIFERLKPLNCVKARTLPGGPAPEEVRRQIRILREGV